LEPTEAASPPTEETKTPLSKESEQEIQPKSGEEPEIKSDIKEQLKEELHADKPDEDHQDTHSTEELTQVSEATEDTVQETPKKTLSSNKYDLLDYLTRFIKTDNELNDVLSGYFARLCNVLIQKKSDEFGKYFYSNEELLYRLAYHSYSKSITDTVIKILDISIDKLDMPEPEVKRIRGEFLKRLLNRLADDKSPVCYEYSLNIFQIFNELAYKKTYYELLVEQSVLNTLGEILEKDSPECSSNAAIRILNVLISTLRDNLTNTNGQQKQQFKWNHQDHDDDVLIQEDEDDENTNKETNDKAENNIKNHHLVTFMKEKAIDLVVPLLDRPPEKAIMDFQYGDNKYVLGKRRLATVNLIESLIELNDTDVKDKILQTDFYEKLFNLFLDFPLNTFLQLHFDNIFHYLIKDESSSLETKATFIKKTGIFDKLPAFWSDNQQFVYPSQREFRHGYLAFTTRIANAIKDF